MNFLDRLCKQYGIKDHPYIASRFGPEAQSAFELVYMPPFEVTPKLLKEAMRNKVYLRKLMNRVVIPIRDETGETIGLVGRVVNDSEITSENPKYYNTVFAKSKVLFCHRNFFETPMEEVWVVEGLADVIKLFEYGCSHVCATLGTSLGEKQINLLNGLNVPVHFMYDGDDAGKRATEKVDPYLFNQPVFVRELEMEYDPDEMVSDGLPLPKPVHYARWWVQNEWKKISSSADINDKKEFLKNVVLKRFTSELKSISC